MRDTGIVRRIDELGRVVIPKEIRKTLRIKEGDPLEIYTDKDELLLKKFSPIERMGEYSNTICDSLCEITGRDCVVTDTDTIIYFGKGKNKDAIGKKISIDLDKIMKDRQTVTKRENEVISLCSGNCVEMAHQIICPIISNGDIEGALVLFEKNKNKDFDETEQKLCELSANIISRYFD